MSYFIMYYQQPLYLLPGCRDVEAIMFVLDSSDKLRLSVAKDELEQLLSHPGEVSFPIFWHVNNNFAV